jgi:sulfopyruvate decarboxylase TPP-binding subunit
MNLWFESFSIIGCCFILKYGSILNIIKNQLIKIKLLRELFNCGLCLGFHIGLWKTLILNQSSFENSLYWAFYSAAICWLADHLIMIIQNHLYPTEQP